jgi:enoyl-CoA hydratase
MCAMSEPLVLEERHPAGYAVLTLNRPAQLNALSQALMAELAHRLHALEADATVRVVILTGSGRAFCAGLDLKELGAGGGNLGGGDLGVKPDDPVAALTHCTKPLIGAINGAAVTGGFELALACDVLLASSTARFADTHARIGVAPGWGLSQRLSRAIGPYRAREVSLTGNWVSAEQAAAWGFVNRVLPAEELLPAARQLALDMLGNLPGMLPRYKAVINEGFALSFGEGMLLERRQATAFNAQVGAQAIEERRAAVQDRNRANGG